MISRNLFSKFGAGYVLGFGLLLAASPMANAQDAPEQPPSSPWIKVCNTNPQTNAEACVVTQELRAETGQPIAVVTLQIGQDGKYGLGVVVPIGFVLPPGIGLNVDGAEVGKAGYTICIPPASNQPSVCLAQAAVNEDFVASLKKGNKLDLVVVNPQQRQIPISLSLAGFSKAFDGPGVDRAAAEAQRKQLSDALQKSAEEARKKLIEQQQKELNNSQ